MPKRNRNIRLSPKHGVNPTIPICFWCGKERSEVALLGRMKDDARAPTSCVLDYEMCGACQAAAELGFAVFEALDRDPGTGMPPLQRNPDLWPTGSWVVLKIEAAARIFSGTPEGDRAVRVGRTFISPEAWDLVGLPRGEEGR